MLTDEQLIQQIRTELYEGTRGTGAAGRPAQTTRRPGRRAHTAGTSAARALRRNWSSRSAPPARSRWPSSRWSRSGIDRHRVS